jgi:protein-S-isoprenylcysteine O-methyltransferase Ste14
MTSDRRRATPRIDQESSELPQTFVQLIAYLARLAVGPQVVVGSWSKTLQLAFLICVPVGAVALLVVVVVVVVVYLKLDPREWGLVASCVVAAASGTSALTWAGRRLSARSARQPGAVTDGEPQTAVETPRT